jgi:hypothetical protein
MPCVRRRVVCLFWVARPLTQAGPPAVPERVALLAHRDALLERSIVDSSDARCLGSLDNLLVLVAGVGVLGRQRPRAHRAHCHAPAEAIGTNTRSSLVVLQTHNDLDGLLVFGDLGMTLGEVTRVLVQGPVAAGDVDTSEDNLVRQIVHVDEDPAEALVFAAEVDFVEDDGVEKVHDDGGGKEDTGEFGSDDERDGQDEGREEV